MKKVLEPTWFVVTILFMQEKPKYFFKDFLANDGRSTKFKRRFDILLPKFSRVKLPSKKTAASFIKYFEGKGNGESLHSEQVYKADKSILK